MQSGGKYVCNDPGGSANSACDITLNVAGNMEMQAGSQINADNLVGTGHGGTILITVGGEIHRRHGPTVPGGTDGALITSQHLGSGTDNGGKITVVAGGVTLDTSVDLAVGICGIYTGATSSSRQARRSPPTATPIVRATSPCTPGTTSRFKARSAPRAPGTGHGGAITIDACCELLVDDTGVVSSRGLDPGPDRVHLQACVVTVYGLV